MDTNAALETFRSQTLQLCDEAEDSMNNENADRQTILENLIDEIRSL